MQYEEMLIGAVNEMLVGAGLPKVALDKVNKRILVPAARTPAVTVGANPQAGAPPLPLGRLVLTSVAAAGALEATYLKEYRATLRRLVLVKTPDAIQLNAGIPPVQVTNVRVGTTSIFSGTEAMELSTFDPATQVMALPPVGVASGVPITVDLVGIGLVGDGSLVCKGLVYFN